MITRMSGRFDIVPIRENTLRQIDASKVPSPTGNFFTVVDEVRPENYPQSSTVWLVYARDVGDNTNNIIRLEPRYLTDSPPLTPNLGLTANVFDASPSDALHGNVLCYYPGDYQENPHTWSESELETEARRHLRDFSTQASTTSGHFLDNRNLMEEVKRNNVNACINFGLYSSRNVWSVLVIVAERDPLSLQDESKIVQEYHIRNQGPTVMDDGRDTPRIFRCAPCGGEHPHMQINYRNERGEYVEGILECQNCGNLVSK